MLKYFSYIHFLIFYLTFGFNLFGQPNPFSECSTLDALGIQNYPHKDSIDCIFTDNLVEVSPLNFKDINNDFSNIADLNWIKTIAKDKKVILLGESHYFQYIANLRNRILFALNTYYYYPLLVLEQPYSKTPFVNHYLMIENDIKAKEFINDVYYLITDEAEYSLLQHIRRWNKTHPPKPIHIGYSDVEHDWRTTITKILVPYFKLIDNKFSYNDLGEFENVKNLFPTLDSLIVIAKAKNLIGSYKFITSDYIKNVISNLKSLYYSRVYNDRFYRQKAIIRNLTSPDYLGKFLTNEKVLIHAGYRHAPTHFPLPDGGNFFREGSYLTYDYEPTKGKTYSIMIDALSYSLGKMKNIDVLSSCLRQGSQYVHTIFRMQAAYSKGLIDPSKFYVVYDDPDPKNQFIKLLIKKGYEYENKPILIKEICWSEMLEKTSGNIYDSINKHKEKIERYDSFIFIPQSPIIVARKKL